MSKKLLIMRHGDAMMPSSGSSDFERRLSEKGINEATKAGQYLLDQKILIDRVLHSTAIRTTMTANLVAEVNRIDSSDIQERADFYSSSVGGMMDSINLLDNALETVLIVGHNPTLSYLIEYLGGRQSLFLSTANIECIAFEADSWIEIGQLSGSTAWFYGGI